MTDDDPNRRHRHRAPRRLGWTHGRDDAHRQRSDDPTGEGPPGGDESEVAPPPRPKHLSAEAQRRLHAARLWVAANRPYYSKALFSCPVIPTAAHARVSIDAHWRIYANSELLESLTVEQVALDLMHVINHALRDHATRAGRTGVDAATAPAWNLAADCEINDDLLEDDLFDDLDDNWMLPADLGLGDYSTAENYFRDILDGAVPIEASTGCGSGCHSHRVPHELADDTAALSDFDRALLKRTVAAAIADYQKHQGIGSVPEGLARWAQQTLNPKVDWSQQLAMALRSSVHHKSGAADYTWQRPSRRQQPQDVVLRPAMTRPVPSITVVVDTSGSMSEYELDQALTEISAIIATVVPGDSVRVLSTDTDVHTDQHIHSTNQISLAGGGGTDMAAGVAAAAETTPDAIVVITDGFTPWPPTRPQGARCVIAALTNDYRVERVPDWIQVVDMSGHFDA